MRHLEIYTRRLDIWTLKCLCQRATAITTIVCVI